MKLLSEVSKLIINFYRFTCHRQSISWELTAEYVHFMLFQNQCFKLLSAASTKLDHGPDHGLDHGLDHGPDHEPDHGHRSKFSNLSNWKKEA